MADKGQKDKGKGESKGGRGEKIKQSKGILESPSTSKTESLQSTSAEETQPEILEVLIVPDSPKKQKFISVEIIIREIGCDEDYANFRFLIVKEGEREKEQTGVFQYPLYNEKTLRIYQKHVKIDESYWMEVHEYRRITPELYTNKDRDVNVNVKMFQEVLSSLSEEQYTPRLPEGTGKNMARICGISLKPKKHVYFNLSRKIASLLEYVLRISLLQKVREHHKFQQLDKLNPREIYFSKSLEKDTSGNKYLSFIRVKLSNNHEEKLKQWKFEHERMRAEDDKKIEKGEMAPDLAREILAARPADLKFEERAVMCRAVDIGPDIPCDKFKVHSLSDVCETLRNFEPQATRVTVESVDTYKIEIDKIMGELEDDNEFLWVRRACPKGKPETPGTPGRETQGMEDTIEITTNFPAKRKMFKSYDENYRIPREEDEDNYIDPNDV